MSSQPVRVPEDVYQAARQIAGLLGTTPGTLLQVAFHEYVVQHRDEINNAFDHAKKYLASQDTEGLFGLASRNVSERAKRAAQPPVR